MQIKLSALFFALKNSSITDNSNYGTEQQIVGYAMGLTSVPRTALNNKENDNQYTALPVFENTSSDNSAPWIIGDYNGYTYSNTFETAMESYSSPLLTAYTAWKETNKVNEGITSMSTWYIPLPASWQI